MDSIYSRLEIPAETRSTAITEEQGECIYDFLKDKEITRTLETGLGYGCSAAYILSATKAPHMAIDPYQGAYKNIGIHNIEKLGLEGRFEWIELPSEVALPELLSRKIAVDFAFIDGGHLFDQIFIDWYYVSLLLSNNGHVMFHDAHLNATRAVRSFIRTNRKDFTEITSGNSAMCVFQKVGKDERKGEHYEPFSAAGIDARDWQRWLHGKKAGESGDAGA